MEAFPISLLVVALLLIPVGYGQFGCPADVALTTYPNTIGSDTDGAGSTYYDANQTCKWSIQCPSNMVVQITALAANVSSGDNVTVTDWDGNTTYSIGHADSTTNNTNALTLENNATVTFVSDSDSSQHDGFSLTYDCVNRTERAIGCPTARTLTAYPGKIESDFDGAGSRVYYNPRLNCKWSIHCPFNMVVQITALVANVSGGDNVTVTDWDGNTTYSIGRGYYADQANSTNALTLENNATVTFLSDSDSSQHYGFSLTYDCVNRTERAIGCPTARTLTAYPGKIESDFDGAGSRVFTYRRVTCKWIIHCPVDMVVQITALAARTRWADSLTVTDGWRTYSPDDPYSFTNITTAIAFGVNTTVTYACDSVWTACYGFSLSYDCIPPPFTPAPTVTAIPPPPPAQSGKDGFIPGTSQGASVGIVVSAFLLTCCIAILIIWLCCIRRKPRDPEKPTSPPSEVQPSSEPTHLPGLVCPEEGELPPAVVHPSRPDPNAFPLVVDNRRDVELSETISQLSAHAKSGAPQMQILAECIAARMKVLSFQPERPEGPFTSALHLLGEPTTALLHVRAKREIAMLATAAAIHTTHKCLARKEPLDSDTREVWKTVVDKCRNAEAQLSPRSKSAGGQHTNGLDFSLDVIQECVNSIDIYLNRPDSDEFRTVLGAFASACTGEYGPLWKLCTEIASLLHGISNGWLQQVVRFSAIGKLNVKQNSVLGTMLEESPVDNWHAVYQWLLLVDHVLHTSTDVQMQELALRNVRASNLMNHESWRVREKVAETVSLLAAYVPLNSAQQLAVELYSTMKVQEEDERVQYTLNNCEDEAKIREVLKEYSETVSQAVIGVIATRKEKLCNAHGQLTSTSGMVVDAEVQGDYNNVQRQMDELRHMQDRAKGYMTDLGLSITGIKDSLTDIGEDVAHISSSLDELPATQTGRSSNLEKNLSCVQQEMRQRDMAMRDYLKGMMIQESEASDAACCTTIRDAMAHINEKVEEVRREGVRNADQELLAALGYAVQEPMQEVLRKYNKPGMHHYMILSDITSSLQMLLGLFSQPTDFGQTQSHVQDFKDRLTLSMQRLGIHFDATSAHVSFALSDSQLLGQINESELQLASGFDAVLGSGGFGTVVKATYHGRQVAVKVIRDLTDSVIHHALAEAKLQSRLCHPNIVALYGVFTASGRLNLVMELCTGGSLNCLFTDQKIKRAHKLKWSLQLAQAMRYLHCSTVNPTTGEPTKILHGDLKPANVMLDEHGDVKLSDFGHSTLRSSSMSYGQSAGGQGHRGTVGYQSPEGFQGQPLTTRSDVYSFGVLLYEIWTRQRTFTTEAEVKAALRDPDAKMPKLDDVKELVIRRVISRCWKADPRDRPSFTEIVSTLNEVEEK